MSSESLTRPSTRISGSFSVSRARLDDCVYFIMGFTLLSRFSAFVVLDVLRFPVYLPELLVPLFLPFLFARHGGHIRRLVTSFSTLLVAWVILLLTVWSHIFNEFGTRHILPTARGYFYIGIFFLIGRGLCSFDMRTLYIVSLGSIASSFFWLLANPVTPVAPVYYVNLIALYLVVVIPVLARRIAIVAVLLPMLVFVGVASGLRRALVVLLAGLSFGILATVLGRAQLRYKVVSIFLVASIFVFRDAILKSIVVLVAQSDLLVHRILIKTMTTFEAGGVRGDLVRIGYIQDTPSMIVGNLYPRGFLTKVPGLTGTGLFMDFPLFELLYTFGALLALPVLFVLTIRVARSLIRARETIEYVIPLAGLLMLGFLALDGGFLFWPYQAVLTGLLLGMLFNKRVQVTYGLSRDHE